MAYEFSYENTPDLHDRVVAALTKHARANRRVRLLVFVVPLIMTISALFGGEKWTSAWLFFVSIILPYWIVYPTLFFLFMRWSTKRAARRAVAEDVAHQGMQVRQLNDAGLHLRNAAVSADVAWSALQSAVETPEFFLIFQSSNCGYALPKAALRNAAPNDVRALLASKLAGNAKLATT